MATTAPYGQAPPPPAGQGSAEPPPRDSGVHEARTRERWWLGVRRRRAAKRAHLATIPYHEWGWLGKLFVREDS
jgi:hypothetical protein